MTPMAHPVPARRYSCPGCATCRRTALRERAIAFAILAVFVGYFVIPALCQAFYSLIVGLGS